MKKIKSVLAIGVVALLLSAISISRSRASIEDSASYYNTITCGEYSPDGTYKNGTKCYTPDPQGPCVRTSDCRFE